ncbi:hypothetical protein AB78_3609 [Escherichia coli 4-203-08_S1_C3]|nr:hypothetical protein AB78_3609 [Escherichia coli 4-203-08_S1_C3]
MNNRPSHALSIPIFDIFLLIQLYFFGVVIFFILYFFLGTESFLIHNLQPNL